MLEFNCKEVFVRIQAACMTLVIAGQWEGIIIAWVIMSICGVTIITMRPFILMTVN